MEIGSFQEGSLYDCTKATGSYEEKQPFSGFYEEETCISYVTSFSYLFLSYLPLWLSILIIDIKNMAERQTSLVTEKCSVIAICLVCSLSMLNLIVEYKRQKQFGSITYMIDTLHEEKSIASEYLLTYILPLSAFNFTLGYQTLLFLLFFLTVTCLSLRHNRFSANIFLEFLGYRFFVCDLKDKNGVTVSKTVISRTRLQNKRKQNIKVCSINNECVIEIKW